MRKIILALSAIALISFTSCKEKASNKVNSENVTVAAERDEAAKAVPVMTFEETEFDFGTIEQNTAQEHIFVFTNTGNAPLIVTDAKSSCGCTVPNPPKDAIAPGEKGELKVKYNGAGQNLVTKTITVTANTQKGQELLKIKAFVNPKGAAPVGPVK